MADTGLEHVNIWQHLVDELPERGIFSQTLLKNDRISVVVMQLAAGEELSEHTSKFSCILHVLQGKGRLQAGEEHRELSQGEVVYMEPHLPHSVTAEGQLVFLLYLLK